MAKQIEPVQPTRPVAPASAAPERPQPPVAAPAVAPTPATATQPQPSRQQQMADDIRNISDEALAEAAAVVRAETERRKPAEPQTTVVPSSGMSTPQGLITTNSPTRVTQFKAT